MKPGEIVTALIGAMALAAGLVGSYVALASHDAVQAVELESVKSQLADVRADLKRVLYQQRFLASMPGPAGDADDAPEFGEAMPEITADTIQEEDERGPH